MIWVVGLGIRIFSVTERDWNWFWVYRDREVFILISHKTLELLWGYREKETQSEEQEEKLWWKILKDDKRRKR